ncbi:uncharacterized protein [Antedon mediterranea]|uniref:uncharacterized protein n=1 Tax=Antedon mediterranea TaxID=105859 RepID=UPI003AF9F09A
MFTNMDKISDITLQIRQAQQNKDVGLSNSLPSQDCRPRWSITTTDNYERPNKDSKIKRKRGRPRKIVTKESSAVQQDSPKKYSSKPSSQTSSRSGRTLKRPYRYRSDQGDGNFSTEELTSEEYECDACLKTFLSRSSIMCHQYICTAEKELCCDLCQEILNSYKEFRTHQKTHGSYACDFCKQEFQNIAEFRIHSRWHTLQTLECNICHRRFLRVKPLKEHMVRVHNQPMEVYTCLMCQKTFALLDILKEHQRTHDGEVGFTVNYIVKPLVKDVAKRNTCIQNKPGKNKIEFVKKVIEHVENKEKEGESIENAVPLISNRRKESQLCIDQPIISARNLVKKARKEAKEGVHLVVHVHEQEGEMVVTTCEPVVSENVKKKLPLSDAIAKTALSQVPKKSVMVLTESEEAVNELVQSESNAVPPEKEQEDNHSDNQCQQLSKDCQDATLSVKDIVQVCEDGQQKSSQPPVGNEDSQPGQVQQTDQAMLQDNHQIYLSNGQTIVVQHKENLEAGQQVYLQTVSENGKVSSQQIIMEGDGPTVFVQEGPDGQQQHVVLQTADECITIDGNNEQHMIVESGDVIANNQQVIVESGDIIANNQHVIVESGDVIANNRQVIVESGDVIANNQQVIVESGDVIADNQHVIVESGDVIANNQQVIVESGDMIANNQHVIMESGDVIANNQQVIVESGDIIANNQQVIVESGDIIADNQQVIVESGDIIANNQHVIVESGDMIANNQHVIMESGDVIANNQQVIVESGDIIADNRHVIVESGDIIADNQQVIVESGDVIANNQHVIVDSGDVIANNQHVIMQSTDGTTLLLESDCSVGDSIIVAAMQNV